MLREAVKDYFMIGSIFFFELHPKEKVIFENAMLRPPKQLAEQIHQLHAPLREMNRKFMARLVATLPLRPGLDREKVARYLESVGSFLQNAMAYYQGREGRWTSTLCWKTPASGRI